MPSSHRSEGYARWLRDAVDQCEPEALVLKTGPAFRRHIGLPSASMAQATACLYGRDGDKGDADLAIQLLLQCNRLTRDHGSYGPGVGADSHSILPAVLAYRLLRSVPGTLSDEIDQTLLAMFRDSLELLESVYRASEFIARSYGQIFGTGVAAGILAAMFPEHPEASRWRTFFKQYHDVWQRRWSTNIDSSGYESNFLYCVALACQLEHCDLATERRACDFLDQLVRRASHLGTQPASGQSYTWPIVCWLPVYEYFGKTLGDGRFVWLADIAWREVEPRLGMMESHVKICDQSHMIAYLASALQWCDTCLAPVDPGASCAITYRSLPARWLSVSGTDAYSPGDAGERWADKLILRGRGPAHETYVCVNLCPRLALGHSDEGAIVEYTHGGSRRLYDSGYFQDGPEYHNLLHVQPTGDFPKPVADYKMSNHSHPGHQFRVPLLNDGDSAALARIEATNYYGLDAGIVREFLLDKRTGVLIVIDRVQAGRCELLASPLFHTQTVPGQGPDWVDLSLGMLDAGFTNTPGGLCAIFASPTGVDLTSQAPCEFNGCVWDEDTFFQRTVAYCKTPVAANEAAIIGSLLIPHEPTEDGQAIRERVHTQHAPDGVTFNWERDGSAFCAGHGAVESRVIETDAEMFLACCDEDNAHATFCTAGGLTLAQRWTLRALCDNPEGAKGDGDIAVTETRPATVNGELSLTRNRLTGTLFAPIERTGHFRHRLWCELSAVAASGEIREVLVDGLAVSVDRRDGAPVRIPVGTRTRFAVEW